MSSMYNVSFSFPKGYDKNYELVIDPVLVFACSSGSTADNFGMTATYDLAGNLYSGGTCFDIGYPVVNPYDSTYNGVITYGRTDLVITKYDSSGTFLHYSTYIGGAISSEIVTSLIVDNQDNLYLHGATGSTDFPITTLTYDNSYNGGDTVRFMFNGTYFDNGTDLYVAKLSSGGNNLLASTFIGGSKNDGLNTNNIIASYFASLYGIMVTGEYPPDSLQYNYGDQYRGELLIDKNESWKKGYFNSLYIYNSLSGPGVPGDDAWCSVTFRHRRSTPGLRVSTLTMPRTRARQTR